MSSPFVLSSLLKGGKRKSGDGIVLLMASDPPNQQQRQNHVHAPYRVPPPQVRYRFGDGRCVVDVSLSIAIIGANALERNFPVVRTVTGVSLYNGPHLPKRLLPLADSSAVRFNGSNSYSIRLCMEGSLDQKLVRRKIVVCSCFNNPQVAKGDMVQRAGRVGMILANSGIDGEGTVSDAHVLPTIVVGYAAR